MSLEHMQLVSSEQKIEILTHKQLVNSIVRKEQKREKNWARGNIKKLIFLHSFLKTT